MKERQQGIYPDPEVDLFMKVCVHAFSQFLDPAHEHIGTL